MYIQKVKRRTLGHVGYQNVRIRISGFWMLIRELVKPGSGMEKSNPGSTSRIRNNDFFVKYLMK